ncbi:MAG: TolC family protein [Cyanobium sp.]
MRPESLRAGRRWAALLLLSTLLVEGGFVLAADQTGAAHTLRILNSRLQRNKDHLERSASRLSLTEALARGLTANPVLAQAFARTEATSWTGVAIRKEWIPSLTAGNNSPGLVGVQQQQADTFSLSSPQVELEWTFFDPSRRPRAEANAAGLAADRFLLDVEARTLVLTIPQHYIDLQALLELEKDYQALGELAGSWRELAKAKWRRGTSIPDVDQLTSEELALMILRVQTHEQVIVAAAKLARSLSLPPGELMMPSERLGLKGTWPLGRQETIDQALRFREEIQQSLAKARSLGWQAVATRKGYLPTLAVGGYGSTQGTSDNAGLQSEGAVGVNVTWTLFDGGLLAAQANAQRKQQDQALQQAALDRLDVTAEVETSHAAYVSSRILVDAALAQVESARASILTSSRGFAEGRSDATTLVQVLNTLRGAQEAYIQAVQKHNRSVAALYRESARWPDTAEALLQRRLSHLRSGAASTGGWTTRSGHRAP